jgi:hypothetical protein
MLCSLKAGRFSVLVISAAIIAGLLLSNLSALARGSFSQQQALVTSSDITYTAMLSSLLGLFTKPASAQSFCSTSFPEVRMTQLAEPACEERLCIE